MSEWKNEWMYESMNEWLNKWMNEGMREWMIEWIWIVLRGFCLILMNQNELPQYFILHLQASYLFFYHNSVKTSNQIHLRTVTDYTSNDALFAALAWLKDY